MRLGDLALPLQAHGWYLGTIHVCLGFPSSLADKPFLKLSSNYPTEVSFLLHPG